MLPFKKLPFQKFYQNLIIEKSLNNWYIDDLVYSFKEKHLSFNI